MVAYMISVFALCILVGLVQSRNPICELPKDAGLQQAAVGAVQRWFFNTQTEECEQFYFVQSGPGNANKFVTKQECEETCKEEEKKCSLGKPLTDKTGRELFCGMSPNPDKCPAGSLCVVEPADRFAVCCPMCPKGSPLTNNQSMQINCGRSSQHQDCPAGSSCVIDPADRFAVCCTDNKESANPKCPSGRGFPLKDKTGRPVGCNIVAQQVVCPAGYSCTRDTDAQTSVCCRREASIRKCKLGNPLTNSDGSEVFCGRGPTRQDCPTGFSCNIDPADAFAVCCRNSRG